MVIAQAQAAPSVSNVLVRPRRGRTPRHAVGGIGGRVTDAWKTWSSSQKRIDKASAKAAAAAAAAKPAQADGKKRRGRPRNDGLEPGTVVDRVQARKMDAAPPLWATWSLGRNATAYSTSPSIVIDDTHVSSVATESATITTLLRHRNDDDIYSSQWEDYFDDPLMLDSQESLATVAKHVKSTLRGRPLVSAAEARSPASLLQSADDILSGEPAEDKNFLKDLNNQILNKPGFLRFDPLTLIESTNLARCLRLSRYVPEPPPPLEPIREDELAFLAPRGEKLTFLEGLDTKHEVRTERRKEAARRDPSSGQPAPGCVDAAKNEAAKELFKSMCRLLLPRRHFDWILAQLTYRRSEMLGRVPAALSLNGTQRHYAEKAKKAVESGEMNPDNAALVLHALADASRLSMEDVELVDPHVFTANLSVSDRRRYKQRQRAESATVTKVLRLLFPEMFGVAEGASDAKLATHARKEAMRRLAIVKQARTEAKTVSDQEAQTVLPTGGCRCNINRDAKTYAETATQTNESAVAAATVQRPKRPFPFTPYETMLPKKAKRAHELANQGDGRRASGTRDNSEAPADDEDSLASEEENEDDNDNDDDEPAASRNNDGYDSDWGDLEYEPVPIEQILDAIVCNLADHKKLYEIAMISFHGRMPPWLQKKFKRDCRLLYRADRKVEQAEQAKMKKAKDAENKLLQLAREREVAQLAVQKKRDQAQRDKERAERDKKRAKERADREEKRKRDLRKKMFRLNKKGKLTRPMGQPRRGDDKIYEEVLAEIKEREAKQFEIETQRATRRLRTAENRKKRLKVAQDNIKFKEIREQQKKKRKEKRNARVSPEGKITFVEPYAGEVNNAWQPTQWPPTDAMIDPRLLAECSYATAGVPDSGGYVVQPLASTSRVNAGSAEPPLLTSTEHGVSLDAAHPRQEAVARVTTAKELLTGTANPDPAALAVDEDATMVNACPTMSELHPAFSQVDLDVLIASVSPVAAGTALPSDNAGVTIGAEQPAISAPPHSHDAASEQLCAPATVDMVAPLLEVTNHGSGRLTP